MAAALPDMTVYHVVTDIGGIMVGVREGKVVTIPPHFSVWRGKDWSEFVKSVATKDITRLTGEKGMRKE